MKKFRFISIALLLCLIPCLTMFACTVKNSYLITATTSDGVLGSVEGMDNDNQKIEGSRVTLKARTKKEGAIFVGWIKNNKELVEGNENDSESLTLVYGEETAGSYTALFRDGKNYQSMLYAKLVSLTIGETSISSITINWARQDLAENEEDSITLTTEIASSTATQIATNKVFYLGKIGQTLAYRFKGNVVKTVGNETKYNQIAFSSTLSKNSQFEDGIDAPKFSIQGIYDSNKTITLTFEKL